MMRFYVSPDRLRADWCHPLELEGRGMQDWTDCTDMDDAAFDAFMAAKP